MGWVRRRGRVGTVGTVGTVEGVRWVQWKGAVDEYGGGVQ